jgi:hypothetical protein
VEKKTKSNNFRIYNTKRIDPTITSIPNPAPINVGQLVPVTGIGAVVADDVAVGVADTVAVGETVAVGDGVNAVMEVLGVEVGASAVHNSIFVVQEAPSEGQQYFVVPQKAVAPTFAMVEQLISSGASPPEVE